MGKPILFLISSSQQFDDKYQDHAHQQTKEHLPQIGKYHLGNLLRDFLFQIQAHTDLTASQ